ncbi:MAG: hypothetical protein JRH16_04400 [Deltaproteobacteria bacterium]|nr:hypothetical protein [Deltaproteobacteria bacterium]MBW2363055.1 hypothetical protein [Deltaproteobacteria bacterium]
MRHCILALVVVGLFLGGSQAEAASCAGFATIKKFDPDANFVKIKWGKGSESRFFPKTEGTPANNSKLPAKCKTRLTKKRTEFIVKPVGGRMSVTQVRMNFSGKMLNDVEDAAWLPARIEKLMADETKVAVVVREGVGKDSPYNLTTIYMPITDEERAEIARLDAQSVDVE